VLNFEGQESFRNLRRGGGGSEAGSYLMRTAVTALREPSALRLATFEVFFFSSMTLHCSGGRLRGAFLTHRMQYWPRPLAPVQPPHTCALALRPSLAHLAPPALAPYARPALLAHPLGSGARERLHWPGLPLAWGSGEEGWEAWIAGVDTMQSRCSISSTSASRSLPSLDPPRHTCRWTSPCTATAGRGCWLQKLMFGESYAA